MSSGSRKPGHDDRTRLRRAVKPAAVKSCGPADADAAAGRSGVQPGTRRVRARPSASLTPARPATSARRAAARRPPPVEWSLPRQAPEVRANASDADTDQMATGRFPVITRHLPPPPRLGGGGARGRVRRAMPRLPEVTRLTLFKACVLLIIAGTLLGTHQPLARMAMLSQPHPLGLALWVNAMTAVLCLGLSLVRGHLQWPRGRQLNFILAWAIIGSTAGEVVLFWVAGELPASLLSVILALEGFMVFGWSLAQGRDHTSLKRFAGLACGLAGVALLVSHYGSMATTGNPAWLLLALLVPLTFAVEDILIVERMPQRLDLVNATGFVSLFGALILLPIAILAGDMLHLPSLQSGTAVAVFLMALTTSIGTVMIVTLLKRYGAIYGSQIGHVITFSGVLWSVLLLGEVLPWQIWPALVLLSAGVWLVTSMQSVRSRGWPKARTVV